MLFRSVSQSRYNRSGVGKQGWNDEKAAEIHAEKNCILLAAKEGVSCLGATIYISLSPCLQCAAMLKQAGITRVVYKDTYRDLTGVQYLMDNQVKVEKFSEILGVIE